jgi:hypothetical protein
MAITLNTTFYSAAGTSTTPARTVGHVPAEGDLMVAFVDYNGTAPTVTVINGWTLVFTGSNGTDSYSTFWKIAGPSESASFAPCTLSASKDWAIGAASFAGCATTSPLEAWNISTDADATKTMVASCDPADGVERLLIGHALTDGSSRTWSGQKFNGSTAGVTAHTGSSLGTAAGGIASTHWWKVENPTVAGNYTAEAICSVADAGNIWLLIFKNGAPANVLTPPLVASGSVIYTPAFSFSAQANAATATATATAPTATLSGQTRLVAATATATAASTAAVITTERAATFGAATATATAAAQVAAFVTYTPGFAAVRVGLRASVTGQKGIQAVSRLAGSGRLAAAGLHGGVQPADLRGWSRLAVATRRGGLAAVAVWAGTALRPTAGPKLSSGLTQFRGRPWAEIVGSPVELPRATNATIVLVAAAAIASPSGLHEGTGTAEGLVAVRAQIVGRPGGTGAAWGWVAARAAIVGLREAVGLTHLAVGAGSALAVLPERVSVVTLRGTLVDVVVQGVMATTSAAAFWIDVDLAAAMTTTSVHPPLGPFDPLVPQNLGSAYRGDTLILPVWQARNQRGIALDLTAATLRFTAKVNLADADADDPTIQCSSTDGSIVVLDPQSGFYQVTVSPNETSGLGDDTVFRYDVQVEQGADQITTVKVGTLTVVRDVTRAKA